MADDRVLIIDDDAETAFFLDAGFAESGVPTDWVADASAAMERLRERSYSGVVLDPLIGHRLNGFAVLNFIELEQPQTLERLFLFTGLSEETIRRTVPSVLPRLFRKPSGARSVAAAVTAMRSLRLNGGTRIRGSVLLVEDDQVTAVATCDVLEELGYLVEWAQCGRDALEALAARTFDAILLDLVMPHMDGFMMIEHLHSDRPRLLRRVIVTTGIPEKYVQALDGGTIAGIVHKPLDGRRLEQLLVDCAGGNDVPFEPGGELP